MPFTFNPFTGALDVVQDISQKVDGPASSTDNAVARYDGTTGKVVQNSSVAIDDTGKMTLGAAGTGNLDAVTKQQLDAVADSIANLDWQEAVIDKDLTAPPVSPSTGDRYLIGLDTGAAVATGAWAGEDGNIATWNGSSWEFYTPVTGAFVGANDEQTVLYNFGGTTWTERSFEATTASGFLSKTGFDIQLTNLSNQHVIVGDGSAAATAVDTSTLGDVQADTVTGLTIKDGSIDNAKVDNAAAIDASKLADGSVSNAEFQQLDGVASPVVGESDTNTLTNKTIDADNNTISNLAHGAEVDNPTSGVHGVTGDVVGTSDTQTLTNKTLNSPVLNNAISGTAFLDEDDLASNSDTSLASQQSIKSYVDANIIAQQDIAVTSIDNTDSPYTVLNTDYFILVDASSGAVELDLPTASGITGKQYVIKAADTTNDITIDPNSTETIDSETTVVLDGQNSLIEIASDGTNWESSGPAPNLVQTNILQDDVTNNSTITDLTFSNLTIGKWYECNGLAAFSLDASSSDDTAYFIADHDGDILQLVGASISETTDTTSDFIYIPVCFKFKATTTTLTFRGSSVSADSPILGNGGTSETHIQLEERNDLRETDKF